MAFADWAAYYRERFAGMERDRAAQRAAQHASAPRAIVHKRAPRPTALVRWHEGKKRP